ncbi:hypothetical protein CBS101457_001307 [Exobasidium rhododendri]|nr:hypothetical protein CBS101457_001307 [Exobasidium rhododendri]
MQFSVKVSLIAVTLALALGVTLSKAADGAHQAAGLKPCSLACITTPPKSFSDTTGRMCHMDFWDEVGRRVKVTGHPGDPQDLTIVHKSEKHKNIYWEVEADFTGAISIGARQHIVDNANKDHVQDDKLYAVGFQAAEKTYWYWIRGGDYCSSNINIFPDFKDLADVRVVQSD